MRVHGCIETADGLGLDGHACWAFTRPEEFTDAALEFLTEGLRLGQRIAFVDDEPVSEQRRRLEPLGGVDGLIEKGALVLFELGALYPQDKPADPSLQLALYSAATDAAVADGYTGLRVAAHVTDLVADPGTREAHLRWESFADRALSTKPLTALCGYRQDALPPRLLHDLAAIHPASNVDLDSVPFHLFGQDGELALAGEVDAFSGEALERALGLACGAGEMSPLNLEALEFIDHRGLEVIARHTPGPDVAGECCAVRGAPPAVKRLCDLLELRL